MMSVCARYLIVLCAFACTPALADIVVNTATDEDTNNASCSLREAITAVNNHADYNGCIDGDASPSWSKITFAISPNAGEVQTLALTSALPQIIKPVFIDATTQTGTVCTPVPNLRVQINRATGTDGIFFAIGSNGSRIRGLAVTGTGDNGTSGLVLASDSDTVGCVISGMDASGTTAMPNDTGIVVTGKSATIGEATATSWFPNIVSGNTNSNVYVYFNAENALIAGNYIGVDKTGLTPLVSGFGIDILGSDVHIGVGFADGPPAHQRNVIGVVRTTGHSSVDIEADSGDGLVISGNYIGVGADGQTVLPIGVGIAINLLNSQGALIGCNGYGTWDYCRNVIASPGFPAIAISPSSTGAAIVSNFIDVAADGVTPLTGADPGSEGIDTVADVLVARNVISAGSGTDITLVGADSQTPTAGFVNPGLAGNGGAPLNSSDNCLTDPTSIGVREFTTGGPVSSTLFVYNWWGAANGPAPNGNGAFANAAVYTVPYLTAPSPYCGFDHIFASDFD